MNAAHSSNEQLGLDREKIRELVENWAVWRDAGFWEKFRTVWHNDGRMMATWTQGTADEFIAMNKAGWAKVLASFTSSGGAVLKFPATARFRRPR